MSKLTATHLVEIRREYDQKQQARNAAKVIYDEVEKTWHQAWQSPPSQNEIDLVVSLVEQVGYRVLITNPLEYGLVGMLMTESTRPLLKNKDKVKRKFKQRLPLLQLYWGEHYVKNYEPSKLGDTVHREYHLAARLRRDVSTQELVEMLEAVKLAA